MYTERFHLIYINRLLKIYHVLPPFSRGFLFRTPLQPNQKLTRLASRGVPEGHKSLKR